MLNRRMVCCCFSTVMLIVCVGFPALASDSVHVATVVYPPLVFRSEVPHFGGGMLRDIATKAFAAEGVNVKYDFLPMSRNVWSIGKKVRDCCLGSMEWFKQGGLENEVEAVDIIKLEFVGFYKVKNFPEGIGFARLADLRGYSFGNVRGSSSQRTLDKAGLKTDLVHNIRLNFLKLNAGRFDFAVAFRVTGEYLLWELFPEKASEFSYTENPIQQMTLAVIFQKQNGGLKERFVRGLEKIAHNGTYTAILKRYYMHGIVPDEIIPDNLRKIAKR